MHSSFLALADGDEYAQNGEKLETDKTSLVREYEQGEHSADPAAAAAFPPKGDMHQNCRKRVSAILLFHDLFASLQDILLGFIRLFISTTIHPCHIWEVGVGDR